MAAAIAASASACERPTGTMVGVVGSLAVVGFHGCLLWSDCEYLCLWVDASFDDRHPPQIDRLALVDVAVPTELERAIDDRRLLDDLVVDERQQLVPGRGP